MSIVTKIYSFFFRCFHRLKDGVSPIGLFCISVRIKGLRGNRLLLPTDTPNYLSSFTFKGTGNEISLGKGSRIVGNIYILGNNSRIIIEDDCSLSIQKIIIRGNNAEIFIGKETEFSEPCSLICQGNNNHIRIGKNCLFAGNVQIWNSDTHQILDKEGKLINQNMPVNIGDHVWLGNHVFVLKGVEIGNNSVIGMGAIVSKSIPNNSIAVGMPAYRIRECVKWSKEYID